ncbi:hypothetical protein [Devosia sp. SL43]|uniref:hypothetical protein n=1 Tax=Devosia sp. SL43 TaxID=2806348 RepID=UPI001F1D2171|nr:hypothetical protein [Devosia sp. SL43]UJW84904.1 hypothetical protein IM737_15985 [Devosia sp. SL43]
MRVPSMGMTLADRRELRAIVAEGYRIAEYMLRDYRDPPTMVSVFRDWFAQVRTVVSTR